MAFIGLSHYCKIMLFGCKWSDMTVQAVPQSDETNSNCLLPTAIVKIKLR